MPDTMGSSPAKVGARFACSRGFDFFPEAAQRTPADPRKPLGFKRDLDVRRDRRKPRKPAKIEGLLTHRAVRRNTAKNRQKRPMRDLGMNLGMLPALGGVRRRMLTDYVEENVAVLP